MRTNLGTNFNIGKSYQLHLGVNSALGAVNHGVWCFSTVLNRAKDSADSQLLKFQVLQLSFRIVCLTT